MYFSFIFIITIVDAIDVGVDIGVDATIVVHFIIAKMELNNFRAIVKNWEKVINFWWTNKLNKF